MIGSMISEAPCKKQILPSLDILENHGTHNGGRISLSSAWRGSDFKSISSYSKAQLPSLFTSVTPMNSLVPI